MRDSGPTRPTVLRVMGPMRLVIVSAGLLCAVSGALSGVESGRASSGTASKAVRVMTIAYRAHDGLLRRADVILPAWYGPRRHPAVPLLISPHGRGVRARLQLNRW